MLTAVADGEDEVYGDAGWEGRGLSPLLSIKRSVMTGCVKSSRQWTRPLLEGCWQNAIVYLI